MADSLSAEARLLCLDELEVTDIADAMIVGRLFNGLFARGVVLVVTSNQAPDDLYRGGPNRESFLPFIARIKAKTDVIELVGDHDYRHGGQPDTDYLYPLRPDTTASFEALWRAATGGQAEVSAKLTVHGRRLRFPRTVGGALRVAFDDVCDEALGVDDYLAIAARFSCVFLEGVSRIEAEDHDRARRLVTLVDALYEAHVRLVVLAQTEPQALFADSAAEDRQRTSSRLEEMRSPAWRAGPHVGLKR